MTLKTKNIDDLRDKVLSALDKLFDGDMDVQEAGVIAKLSETIISGLKVKMDYARLTSTEPHIPFLHDPNAKKQNLIESKPVNLLEKKK